jgi:hypothetical protein
MIWHMPIIQHSGLQAGGSGEQGQPGLQSETLSQDETKPNQRFKF